MVAQVINQRRHVLDRARHLGAGRVVPDLLEERGGCAAVRLQAQHLLVAQLQEARERVAFQRKEAENVLGAAQRVARQHRELALWPVHQRRVGGRGGDARPGTLGALQHEVFRVGQRRHRLLHRDAVVERERAVEQIGRREAGRGVADGLEDVFDGHVVQDSMSLAISANRNAQYNYQHWQFGIAIC